MFLAIRRGDLQKLKAIHFLVTKTSLVPCLIAAENGHLEILTWLINQGYRYDSSVPQAAACHGHLPIIQYLRSIGCPWDGRTPATAAYYGHYDILKWCIENHCPYKMNAIIYAVKNSLMALERTPSVGDLENLD
jgi:hypothetical protein